MVNYEIGDEIVSKDNPFKIIGKCTGFIHNETCVEIDGACWGGKFYFEKSELVEHEVIETIISKNYE